MQKKMSHPHAWTAHKTGWQTPTWSKGLINVATRITEGSGPEKTNFSFPQMTQAWPTLKGW